MLDLTRGIVVKGQLTNDVLDLHNRDLDNNIGKVDGMIQVTLQSFYLFNI